MFRTFLRKLRRNTSGKMHKWVIRNFHQSNISKLYRYLKFPKSAISRDKNTKAAWQPSRGSALSSDRADFMTVAILIIYCCATCPFVLPLWDSAFSTMSQCEICCFFTFIFCCSLYILNINTLSNIYLVKSSQVSIFLSPVIEFKHLPLPSVP